MFDLILLDKIENYLIIVSIFKGLSKCVLSILRGIGQIFLQSNSITGIFYIVAMFYENWVLAVVAISCTIISTITAKLVRFNDENIMQGLYGFNSSLIGCALVFYFEISFLVVVCFIIGSIVSTFVMEFFLRNKLPSYTFPFIVVTWILLAIMRNEQFPVKEKSPSPIIDYKVLDDYSMPSHSFGQVIFLGDCISGLLVLIGCYISTPIGTLYAIISTIISQGISIYFGAPVDSIHAGLYGFNAVLVGIALGGKKTIDGLYVLIGLIISSCFYVMVVSKQFTGLTFPFVLASWFIRLLKWTINIKYYKKESIIYHLKSFFKTNYIIIKLNNINNNNKKNNNNNNHTKNKMKNIHNNNNNNIENNNNYTFDGNNDIITNNEIIMKTITPLNSTNILLDII